MLNSLIIKKGVVINKVKYIKVLYLTKGDNSHDHFINQSKKGVWGGGGGGGESRSARSLSSLCQTLHAVTIVPTHTVTSKLAEAKKAFT